MSAPAPSLEQRAARRIGTTLRGKYRIERVLGVGGMAAVYVAVHRNGYRVAIKMLHDELSLRADTRARFLREGYVANAVGHPGAVRVLDDDVADDGAAFLVMELLHGETLRARSQRLGGRLPCHEVLALGHQLLDVLGAAHAAGIIHRDIKPDNLFLTTDRALKVLDFGIARIEDDAGALATATGTRLGTPAFMPPELALGRTAEIDGRTDLWSAGATLFTLLTGRFVHEFESAAEIVVRAATEPARSLGAVAPEAAPVVTALIDRALAFAREDRWPSARAMQEAIEAAYVELVGERISREAIGEVADGEERPDPEAPTQIAPSDGPSDEELAATQPASRDERGVTTQSYASDSGGPARVTVQQPAAAPQGAPPRRLRWLAVPVVMAAIAGGWLRARRAPEAAVSPGASAPSRGCVENRACVAANGGQPFVCRKEDGQCVALASEDCRVLAGPDEIGNDATVWFGAMYPIREPDPYHYGPRSGNAVELARRDFAETTGGLPPARPGGPKRPIGVVLCDDRANPERAAEHLVNELRVPAVLGFASSKEVLDLATSHFLPKKVLALAATSATTLRDIPRAPGEPRLVWRVTTATDLASWPLSATVEQVIEPELRAIPGLLRPGEPIRVAQLRQDSPAGQSTVDSRIAVLHFNGKSVAENGDAYRQIGRAELDDPNLAAANARTAEEIRAFLPHVVLDVPPSHALLAEVERRWPEGAPFRPRYLSEGVWSDLGPAAFDWKRHGLYRRLFSVDMLSSGAPLVKFALRYSEFFSPRVNPETAPNAPYDGFYLLVYAAAALGDQPITGPALARAIARLLPPGEPIDVGPGGIYPAFYALAAGKNVDLRGAATSLDFDLDTGEAAADFALYCLSPASPARQIESGLVFDPRGRSLRGSRRCP